jgi:hypothetical protein
MIEYTIEQQMKLVNEIEGKIRNIVMPEYTEIYDVIDQIADRIYQFICLPEI